METEEGVPLRRRAAAAGIAACVSAVVVNPLDVVKTRIQAQGFRHAAAVPATDARAGFSGRTHAGAPQFRAPSRALAVAGCPPTCPTTGNPHVPRRLCAPECATYTSSFDVLRKIVRQEGARALFRGTSAALLVAVPTVGIYLPLYDYGNDYLKRKLGASRDLERLAPLAPAIAGATSRAFAVLCVAPLDLVRTRAQASRTVSSGTRTGDRFGVWTSLSDAARGGARTVDGKNGGGVANANEKTGSVFGSFRRSSDAAGAVRRLWTGAGPTLARDVPYSALYWFAVEHLRRTATDAAVRWKTETQSAKSPKPGSFARGGDASLTPTESLCAHFFSGAVAGGAVAALTTPLDVVKTRVQIRDAPSLLDFAGGMSKTVPEQTANDSGAATTNAFARRGGLRSVGLFGELSAVARQGGVSALFAGWAPRAARAGPTCGIVLVAYEMAKNAPV